jgi:hypothetical protein
MRPGGFRDTIAESVFGGGTVPENTKPRCGSIEWHDLTVENAEAVRDFYEAVVGWKPEPVNMGDYSDFNMTRPDSGEPAAGICHSRGVNTDLPPAWLIYISVEDIDASLREVAARGGRVLRPASGMGPTGRYAVIQDPAGAVCALFEPASA